MERSTGNRVTDLRRNLNVTQLVENTFLMRPLIIFLIDDQSADDFLFKSFTFQKLKFTHSTFYLKHKEIQFSIIKD